VQCSSTQAALYTALSVLLCPFAAVLCCRLYQVLQLELTGEQLLQQATR